MADFLLALANLDRQKLWRELGHTSLFYYLHRELKLSKGAAQNRKTAAELIQAFPEVEAALRAGELCLSTVNELARVLTPEIARMYCPGSSGSRAARPRRSPCRSGRPRWCPPATSSPRSDRHPRRSERPRSRPRSRQPRPSRRRFEFTRVNLSWFTWTHRPRRS